jgi:tRNA dimethylallyltransferase
VAVELAQVLRNRGEDPVAVSADALQVYEGLGVLTGVERTPLEHRLVGFVPVSREFSVGEFMPLAHGEIDAALEAGRRPIVVGGTGLYLRAALCELDLRPQPPSELRARREREIEVSGPEALHAELRERAPATAATIEPTDRSRIVRALELLDMGEELEPAGEDSQLWTDEMRRPTLLVGLTMDRDALYERIERRVDEMVAAGAEDEVRHAEAAGASRTARAALGYEELLAGDADGMKRRSRNYAKRQLTWMRKLARVRVIDLTGRSAGEVASEIAALA